MKIKINIILKELYFIVGENEEDLEIVGRCELEMEYDTVVVGD